MVKIRLRKLGHTHNAFYRVVVSDSHSPRDGRFIEEIGYYNPYIKPTEVKIDKEAAIKWLKYGAKPSDTVNRLFKIAGINK